MTRVQVTVLLALAAIVWGVWLFIAGAAVGMDYLAPFSLTVGVVTVAVALFNIYIWRWPIFRGWLVSKPDLAGTWRVRLDSDYVDLKSGGMRRVDAYFVVRQTYLNVSIRMFSPETSSKTLAAALTVTEDDEWTLHGSYLDTPLVTVDGQRNIHYGAFYLVLSGKPVASFQGRYWTDRKTRGNIGSAGVLRHREFGSYREAAAAKIETK